MTAMKKDKAKFSVQMTAKEVYRFNMYHVYHSFSGLIGIGFSIIALIILLTSFSTLSEQTRAMLIIIAAWFVVFDPVILFTRSRGQAKRNKAYQQALNYEVNEAGITVSQNEEHQTIAWDNLFKIVETKTQFLVYSSKMHAFIFPKSSVGMSEEQFREVLLHYAKDKGMLLKGKIKNAK